VRLRRLAVEGFRGLARGVEFDLDANAIIVIGANGQGKTSFFDALLWGLTGQLPRLGEEPEIVCLYSESGQARVEIELADDGGGSSLRMVRSHDGSHAAFTLELDGHTYREEVAESRLHETLWPDALVAPDSSAALTTTLTRSVYLQQDVVSQFIDGDSARERFEAVSELVGAGRVTELTSRLESAKRAWSGQTNRQDEELEELRGRLAAGRARLEALRGAPGIDQATLAGRWDEWWKRAAGFEDVVDRQVPPATDPEAAAALELAVKRLDVQRLSAERRATLARALMDEIERRAESAGPPHDLERLEGELGQAEDVLSRKRDGLEAAEEAAARERRRRVELREREQELSALAELALRNIEGPCPVCGQEHDLQRTRERLERLIGNAGDGDAGISEGADSVDILAAEVEETRSRVTQAREAFNAARAESQEHARWLEERDRRLRELGLAGSTDRSQIQRELDDLLDRLQGRSEEADDLQARGERLALEVAGLGEQARREETERSVTETALALERAEGELAARRQSGERAAAIVDALRDASSSVVDAQLSRVEPLLQRIYATADPHPSLRDIRLALSVSRGKGRLDTPLDDSQRPISASRPAAVLSSSQRNALAVSVFLALNLGVPSLPLKAAMLDDPLQSLDDVNLLGLIDLLRRTKDLRQLVVSTHDRRFGRLLERKLRPVTTEQRTVVIELTGWGRGGPTVTQSDTKRDEEIIRIAA
jgi:DNA repair exonuclease SbcCD ATPase subunit